MEEQFLKSSQEKNERMRTYIVHMNVYGGMLLNHSLFLNKEVLYFSILVNALILTCLWEDLLKGGNQSKSMIYNQRYGPSMFTILS